MSRHLSVETLETRVMPAVFGTPWPDAAHLTVSFVADNVALNPAWTDASGTAQQGPGSQLFATLGRSLSPAAWQGEILRALQTWAAQANIDITPVRDSGDPLGTEGAIQGDSRFGDIRIAAQALSTDALAIATPFSTLAGTRSGDIIFNTNYKFGIGAGSKNAPQYDLYTTALHEAGHALGLGDGTDRSSVMYHDYLGVRTGLGATDVASIDNLYGARKADAFEGDHGNDTLETATSLTAAAWSQFEHSLRTHGEEAPLPQGSPLQVVADLTTTSDVDVYSYQATKGFQVRLQASDLGLLMGRLTVLDEDGNVVGQATASAPGQDLVLNVAPTASGKLFFRVDSTRDDGFGIGHYRLVVEADDPAATAARLTLRETLLNLVPDNDSLQHAVGLEPLVAAKSSVGAYAVQGRLSGANDIDYYRLIGSSHSRSLTVFLSGTGEVGLSVLDKDGNVLAHRVAQGSLSLHLDDLDDDGRLYLVVTGSNATPYRLSALRNPPADAPALTATGTLTASAPAAYRGLVLPSSTLVRMDLRFASTQPGAAIVVILCDSQGTVVYRQVVPVGQKVSIELYLPAGGYTFCFVGGVADGSALSDIAYEAATYLLSDPIGPQLINPDAPPPPPPDPGWNDQGFFSFLALLDPFGRPLAIYYPPTVAALPPNLPPLPPAGSDPLTPPPGP